jgi:hypothetical protein
LSGILAFAAIPLIAPPIAAKAQALTAEQALANYKKQTTIVQPRCAANRSSDEIIVCAENQKKYRLPPQEPEPGNPKGEHVSAERERLLREPPVKCGLGAILTGSVSVGISHTSKF